MMLRLLLPLLLLCAAGLAGAQPAGDPSPLQFHDTAEEARFHQLTAELRCVQCQNQSLADSNAQIAHDLRREVLVLMREGRSDAQVKQFLVERYGDFVLYRPQMSASTWLLWFGPGVLLLIGALWLFLHVRRRAQTVPLKALDEEASQESREW
ncbi:cytochrome c-type biogenesis protein [Stenotrophomonas sp. JC08]|uniref:cytochrome c-type biogenesis protein n=1 Tax=Stenotrophomonas sp. JC08 TaxID=3445779 RepID=UPI003FA2D559